MIARLYRLALHFFPPAFRVGYAECMTADFEDGLADARRFGGRGHLCRWLSLVAFDLCWSITRQWLRTSVPWLTAAYAVWILTIVEGLAAALFAREFFLPVALLPVVSAFTFAVWFVPPQSRRDPGPSIRA